MTAHLRIALSGLAATTIPEEEKTVTVSSSSEMKTRSGTLLLLSAGSVVLVTGGWFAFAWNQSHELHLVGDSFGPLTAMFSGLGLVAIWFALVHEGRVSLEHKLGEEYRSLLRQLPIQSIVPPARSSHAAGAGERATAQHDDDSLRLAFCCFDLSNTQAYFYQCRQVRKQTWQAWGEGIRDNMMRQWFVSAWREICERRGESQQMSQHLRFLYEEVVARNTTDNGLRRLYGERESECRPTA